MCKSKYIKKFEYLKVLDVQDNSSFMDFFNAAFEAYMHGWKSQGDW